MKDKLDDEKKFIVDKKDKFYCENYKFYGYATKDCWIGKVEVALVAKDVNAIWLNSQTFDNFDEYDGMLYLFILYMNLIVEDASDDDEAYDFDVEDDDYVN